MKPSKEFPVICWWSGGIPSAVAAKKCIRLYGKENVRVIFIDPLGNEHPDTYRFIDDCEKWYGMPIERLMSTEYDTIQDVWYDCLGLNFATGAKCSSDLKRKVRQQFIKRNNFSYQVFGFDKTEKKRMDGMSKNNAHLNPIYPLKDNTKKWCIEYVQAVGIEIPVPYQLGYRNNNCFRTGCVQGGIGYWQKIQRDDPPKFLAMAKVEHELTDVKGEPVYMLSDQSGGNKTPVFLMPHPKYPHIKHIGQMKGRKVEPLADCNGFCGKHQISA